MKTAFATMTSRQYVPLTAVMIHSLAATETKADIIVMTLPDTTPEQVAALRQIVPGLIIYPVTPLPLPPQCRIYYGNWRIAIQKIQVWRLVQYARVVYLDSDMLVLTNVDELLELDELHASPTWVPQMPETEIINSGMITLAPSEHVFRRLYETLKLPSILDFPGHGKTWFLADQELITAHYSEHSACGEWRQHAGLPAAPAKPWKHLPYYYNAVIGDKARLAGTWNDAELKIVHFTDCIRPWLGGTTDLDAKWMAIFRTLVGRKLIID